MDLVRHKVDGEAQSGSDSEDDAAAFAVLAKLLVSLCSLNRVRDGRLIKVDRLWRWFDGRILFAKGSVIASFAAILWQCVLMPIGRARERCMLACDRQESRQ